MKGTVAALPIHVRDTLEDPLPSFLDEQNLAASVGRVNTIDPSGLGHVGQNLFRKGLQFRIIAPLELKVCRQVVLVILVHDSALNNEKFVYKVQELCGKVGKVFQT